MGGHEGGEGGGKHEEEGGLGAIGTLMHWMGIGSHVAEGAKPWLEVGHLVHEGKGIFDALGHVGAAEAASVASKGTGGLLPYLGAVTGTIQAGVEGYEAYENFAKEGYHSDKAWTNVGGATLGAAGAAVTFIPGYGPLIGAGLAAGEMAADAGGWAMGKAFGKDAGFSSNQMVGNFIRGTFGDKSWGESVSNMVGGGVGGHVLGTAVNVLASPLQFGAQIGSQVLGEIGSIGSGILHGQGVVGGAIHDIGAGIGNVASSVGSGIAHAGSAILDFLSDARLKRDVRPIAGALALLARVS